MSRKVLEQIGLAAHLDDAAERGRGMRAIFALSLALAVLAGPSSGMAVEGLPDLPAGCLVQTLPVADPTYPEGQLTLTCLPPDFNGQLFVYAHGYVRPQEALSLPVEELETAEVREALERVLAMGFGFATTSYRKNGYAVEAAQADIADLVDEVREQAPETEKVWLIGASEGALITAMLVERFPQDYEGGLALCGPLGGMPEQIAYLADFRAVFDHLFPGIFPFGAVDVPPDAHLEWDEYEEAIAAAVIEDEAARRQLFKVTDVPCDAEDGAKAANCAQDLLAYSIFGTNDLQATSGGQPYGNRTRAYEGSEDDAALNAGIERFGFDARARRYVRQWYRPTGRLERPLVTLHTTQDPIVPFWHERVYLERVARAGDLDMFTPLPVFRSGHCAFEAEEVVGGLVLLLFLSGAEIPAEAKAYLRSLPDASPLFELLDEETAKGKRRLRRAIESLEDRLEDLF